MHLGARNGDADMEPNDTPDPTTLAQVMSDPNGDPPMLRCITMVEVLEAMGGSRFAIEANKTIGAFEMSEELRAGVQASALCCNPTKG